jgi:signal transduction histidine kinase
MPVEAPQLQRLLDKSPAWILRVQKDRAGTLWATHEQGVITFVPRNGEYQIDTKTFDLNNDHYPIVQLQPGNEVWLSSARSLYHVEANRVLESAHALRPMLVSVADGRTNAELFIGAPATDVPLQLPYVRNNLSFRFFAGSYAWRRAPTYEFRLNSVQNEWTSLGTSSLLSFPVLREGNYRLEVRIADSRNTAPLPASFDFEILPPWYRTWSAYALCAGVAGLAVFGLVRWLVHRTHHRNLTLEEIIRDRTEQLRTTMHKLNEETRNAATLAERDRLAGEIHDSLQQGLSGLILQLDATLKLTSLTDDVRARLNVARNMVSFTRHEVQHAVWDMESPLLESTELGEALRKITALISSGIANIEISVSGPAATLPSAMQHHLLRIAQEAITNSVRHAAPNTIVIRLEYQADTISLTVMDDGMGFYPDDVLVKSIGHFGLRGLRGRANKIGGKLQIESSPGRGTSISVVVPLANLHDHVNDPVTTTV